MRIMNEQDVKQLIQELTEELPGFEIRYKNESRLQKIIGYILFFNRRYMTNYTTTIGKKVYFPSREWAANNHPNTIYRILSHEAVHVRDYCRFWLLFAFSYLLLLPTVFTFRAFWEFRAYKENIRQLLISHGSVAESYLDSVVRQFTTSAYLWMCPFPRFVRKTLNRYRAQLQTELLEETKNGK